MLYPDEIIEEVRVRNDIVDVISEYAGLKKAGNSYKCCCPFHNEKTPSFTVSREKQMYHCFGCGAGGNVYTFIMKYENLTFPEAIQFLAKRAGITLPERELSPADRAKADRRTTMYEVNKIAAAYFHFLLTKTEAGGRAYQYYKERGYTDETIKKFGLGYAEIYSDDLYKYLKKREFKDEIIRDAGLIEIDEKKGPHDVFWNRVMVPIADINDKIIAFGGRVIGDGLPKYVNTKETDIFSKSRNLFAMNLARKSKRRGIILCEGYMDVIAQHQAGFDNAVASLGTAFTEAQANLIKRYTDEVFLAYDNDDAGRKALLRAIEILRKYDIKQRVISLEPYKDPDEFVKNLGTEAYEDRIRDAIPGRIFEIDQIYKKYNLSNPDEKTEFMHGAAAILAGIEDPAERINYVEAVAAKYRCDQNELKKLVTKIGLSGMKEAPAADTGQRYINERKKDKNPYLEAEEYLMSLMISDTELFKTLDGIVDENDFTETGTREVARAVFDMYRDKGEVNPATILNGFEDADLQERVTAMMTRSFDFDTGPEAMSRALTDIVRKVKINNIEKEQRDNKGSQIELARKKNQVRNLMINVRR
ncbi:MAG: DNA primase [Eubacterium sp.]|nr:DNA primase [Eubacterium sp.]